MSDALEGLASAIRLLSTDLLCAQVEIVTKTLLLDLEVPTIPPGIFSYWRATLDVLLAECEHRKLSPDEAMLKGRDSLRRWVQAEIMASGDEPVKPKVH